MRPRHFNLARCLVAAVLGGVGLGLGAWLGMEGGHALDKALGYPLGRAAGFIGNVTWMCGAAVAPLGAVVGAFGGHALLSGRGSFWRALGTALLGLVPVLAGFLGVAALLFPTVLLVPLAAAVVLELSNMSSE
ncbi:MAG TPA: hypothetical protein VFZ09_33450 [Archangium sp.]|uniref:hypothetical protein n=1 Tax=Archangium sp. TaxID=1872627 RepID=UPI002E367097|nr:hypothetical protein [Archangium sp.]HEX5751178.1 hypothetical protein [Archangium sp.]